MRKVVAMLTVLVMVVSLFVGCGSSAENNSQQDANQTSGIGSETTGEANSEITGKITYMSWMTKGEDEPLIEDFMKEYPGVEVEVRTLDGATYGTDFLTLCAGGDVPDVFLTETTYLADLVDLGYAAPIDGFAGVENQTDEEIKGVCSRDGNMYLYALNGGLGKFLIYYNKQIFDQYGLSEPTTVEELDEICEILKQNGVDPMLSPAGDTWNANYFAYDYCMAAINELGGPVAAELAVLEGNAKPSDIYLPMFEKMADYKNKGYVSEAGLSMGWETGAQYFVDGNTAMFCTGNWFPGSTPVVENPEFEFGCFVTPGIPVDGTCLDYLFIDRAIGVSAKTEYPEAARALVEYFIREDVLSNYLTRQGLTGINISVPSDPVFESVDARLSEADYVLSPLVLMPDMPTGWDNNMFQYSADVLAGSDPVELAQKLDDEYASFIAGIDVQSIIDGLK